MPLFFIDFTRHTFQNKTCPFFDWRQRGPQFMGYNRDEFRFHCHSFP